MYIICWEKGYFEIFYVNKCFNQQEATHVLQFPTAFGSMLSLQKHFWQGLRFVGSPK